MDCELANVAPFSDFTSRAGVVAQLVEHHNGIEVLSQQRLTTRNPSSIQTSPQRFCGYQIWGKMGENLSAQEWTLAFAIERMLERKARLNLRATYLTGLRQYLSIFARGREQTPISEITHVELETWFDGRHEAHSSQQSNLGRLSALFIFCKRRGIIESNPCDLVERVRVDKHPPKILTVAESRMLLECVSREHPKRLAYFVLCLLAGVRPIEATRLTREKIDLVRGTIRVDSDVSKVRTLRYIHLMPAAAAYLKLALEIHDALLPISRATQKRWVRDMRDRMKFAAWPSDILRKTFASYLISEWQDAARVSLEMGNSPGVLLRFYRELVTREQAEEFWSIRPLNTQQLEMNL